MKTIILTTLTALLFLVNYHLFTQDINHNNIKNIIEIKDKLELPFPFFDDFENGLGNWQVSGQDWDTVSVSYSSATHSVHSNPGGNYLPFSNASLTLLNAIDLSASNLPVLTFWHKFQADDGVDLCRVEVSEDYGYNWSEITSFSGSNLTWSYVQIDLSAYKSVPIKLRFRLTSNGGYEYFGWNIDDVELSDFNSINIDSLTILIPQKMYLYPNYPNPFNPTTEISWQLAVGTPVRLAIYDLTGQEVAVLVNEKREAGYHQVRFDGSDLASGIYLYRLQAGQYVETRKMILMK